MSNIFPTDFDEKTTIAENDYVLFSDSEDWDKLKKAKYSNLKGEKWDTWDTGTAATITVWSTTTGEPWTSASVTNSWTSSAAVLNFTIPKWDKWNTGDPGTAATITVWTTTTWDAWTSASVTNSGTSSAAVFNFTIPKGSKWDTGAAWQDGQDWADGASIVSAAFDEDDMVFTDSNWDTITIEWAKTTLTWPQWVPWQDGADWEDWVWIASVTSSKVDKTTTVTITDTDGNSESFDIDDWADGQDGTDWTDGADGNGISSVTSSKNWKTTTVTMSFTDTSMSDFSFQVQDGADWSWSWDMSRSTYDPNNVAADAFDMDNMVDWTNNHFISSSEKTVLGNTSWTNTWDQTASDFDIKDLTDSTSLRTTWSNKADTTIINDTAYWAWWDSDTTHAPTKNAVYDKISAMDTTISWKADSSSLGTAATKNTWTSSGNVPVLDANGKLNTTILPALAITDTFTVSTTSDLTGLSSAEKWDVAIVTWSSETYILSADPYSTSANWKKLATPTDTVTSVNSKTWAVTLDADDISDTSTTHKFVTTQTAYTTKWTSTKVPTITTNSLGQVTAITETDISYPSQVDDTAYANTWDWVTTTAPSKNAVYDKINAMDTTIAGKLSAETVVSGDSGTTYTVKVSSSAPASWTSATTITFVTA